MTRGDTHGAGWRDGVGTRDGHNGTNAHGSSTSDHGSANERLCKALCSLETPEEASALLQDLCSPGEVADLAQRLEMATMLWDGASYAEVCSATSASSTTVSRVSKCLKSDAGGYRLVLGRLAE